jgi:hypothetical protein
VPKDRRLGLLDFTLQLPRASGYAIPWCRRAAPDLLSPVWVWRVGGTLFLIDARFRQRNGWLHLLFEKSQSKSPYVFHSAPCTQPISHQGGRNSPAPRYPRCSSASWRRYARFDAPNVLRYLRTQPTSAHAAPNPSTSPRAGARWGNSATAHKRAPTRVRARTDARLRRAPCHRRALSSRPARRPTMSRWSTNSCARAQSRAPRSARRSSRSTEVRGVRATRALPDAR